MTKFQHHYPISARKSDNKIKKWFFKWDRAIAAITAVLVFFALLSLVIFNITTERDDDDDDQENDKLANESTILLKAGIGGSLVAPTCRTVSDSVITCQNGNSELLVDSINEAAKNIKQEIELQLIDTNFNNNTIDNGWLSGLKVPLKKLQIKSTALLELGSEVFAGEALQQVTYLIIDNTGISNYKKNSFKNAKIGTLEIKYNENKVVTVEEDCFGYLANTLTSLQIQNCIHNNDFLINITGSRATNLTILETLDIRSNVIGTLTDESFSSVSRVKRLYASNAGLNDIGLAAFSWQKFITLDISFNYLTYLPPKTFTPTNIIGNRAITFQQGNAWDCNCNLVWLRDFVDSNSNRFFDQFVCTTESGALIPYEQVNFCDDQHSSGAPTPPPPPPTTTSSTNSPTLRPTDTTSTDATTLMPDVSTTDTVSPPSTATPLPPADESVLNAKCTEGVEQLETNVDSDDWIQLRKETVTISFQIEKETSEGYDYQITITGNVSKLDSLLVLVDLDVFSLKECVTNLVYNQTKTTLSLTASKTYTYCLLKDNNNLMVDPLDCKSLATPAFWGNRTFIANNAKLYCIIGVSVTLLLAVLVTCLISFFCIRQHPEWIKSNHRVVIIKEDKSGTRIFASPYYDQVPYVPPSLSLQSDNSYLVPTNRNIYHESSIGSIRTISQNISIPGPSHIDSYNRYRMRKANKRRNRIHSDPTEDNLYESAPPLPPNHPKFSRHPLSLQYSRV